MDYGLAIQCYNISLIQLPLEGNKKNDVFKIYFQDSGLFVSMLEPGSAGDILTGNMGIYKGAVYENIIADAFSKMGRKLYYYRRDNGTEIDFIIRFQGKPTLVEVKAKSGKTKAADYILSNQDVYDVDLCIKLGDYNVCLNNNKLTIPYYMAFLLTEDKS